MTTMRDDQFRKLLHAADAADSPPGAPSDLAFRVRELQQKRRRTRRRTAMAAPLVLAALIGSAWQLVPKASPPGSLARDTNLVSQRDLDLLTAEAKFHERLARRMVADRRRDEARMAAASYEAPDSIREQLEIVAYGMILQADALRAVMQPAEKALEVYRNVVRLFPATNSAKLARQRLAELGTLQRET
jgi:hypothetical protein